MAGWSRVCINAGYKAQHGKQRHHRGAAVADKGQGQADNRGDADAHTDVAAYLENQSRGNTVADQPPHIVGAAGAHINTAGDDQDHQDHGDQTADKAQFLADGRVNIVCMLGVQGTFGLGAGAFKQALTGHAAAGERTKTADGVVPLVDTIGVNGFVKQDQDTPLLIAVQKRPKEGSGNGKHTDGQSEPNQADTSGECHACENKDEDQGNAQVPGDQHIQA